MVQMDQLDSQILSQIFLLGRLVVQLELSGLVLTGFKIVLSLTIRLSFTQQIKLFLNMAQLRSSKERLSPRSIIMVSMKHIIVANGTLVKIWEKTSVKAGDFSNAQMVNATRDFSSIINFMVKGNSPLLLMTYMVETNVLDTLKGTSLMVLELFGGQMATDAEHNGYTIKWKGKVFIHGRTALSVRLL